MRTFLTTASTTMLLAALAGCATNQTASLPGHALPAPEEPYAMIDGEVVPVPDFKMGDKKTINKVINEAQTNSQVMDHLTTITKQFGARITGSRAEADAARWAKSQFDAWGLDNTELRQWGTIATRFDRGPSHAHAYLAGSDNVSREFEFSTLAWTTGTNGPVRGNVVRMPTTAAEFDAVKDDLEGAWILIGNSYDPNRRGIQRPWYLMRPRHQERIVTRNMMAEGAIDLNDPELVVSAIPDGFNRWTGTFDYNGQPVPVILDLSDLEADAIEGTMTIEGFHDGDIDTASFDADSGALSFSWPNPIGETNVTLSLDEDTMTGSATSSAGAVYAIELKPANADDYLRTSQVMLARILAEEPAGFLSSSGDERVWTTSKTGWRETELSDYGQDVEVLVRQSDYDFLNSQLADGVPVELDINLDHRLQAGPIPVYNVIGEIVGTERPDEVVIMSAHLDSWNGPGSEGTVDNGTGSSVTLEAARLLAEAGAKPERTIRFILWTGEEQGLLGSRAYVETLSEEERAKISAVFVDDGGTNYQGGTFAIDSMVEMLAAATAPTNGRFFSQTDYDNAMNDDNPDNDAMAGILNVSIRNIGDTMPRGGGSDHAAFNAVGIPGFFWDETGRANYRYAWHTQHDTLDQAIPEYLIQSSANTAITLFNLASAETLLPRQQPAEQSASAE